ncbi:MAG: NAD(P)-binding protein [Woeseiaceae bacterium]|nr:NAD(P)-binding protein [Woeseiaceae bacterium]
MQGASQLTISRRDFLNGCALSLAAGTALSPLEILAMERAHAPYPPLLQGMRGSQAGSFEVAHAAALSGARFGKPEPTNEAVYDMVVVGGGLSGLSAAHFYRQRAGKDKRVLVLDNHDDFGGHARRNEFDVDGRRLLCYGGSQSIDTPSEYSDAAAGLLKDLGIHLDKFYEYFDRSFFERRNSRPAIYFDADIFGKAATLPNALGDFRGRVDPKNVDSAIDQYPIDEDARLALKRLLFEETDYLAGRSLDEKISLLRKISYSDFLRKHAGMPEAIVGLLRDNIKGYWGVGWDALSALEAYRLDQPGMGALELETRQGRPGKDLEEPYIFHFPDGNASIARALVRELVPGCISADTMEALVTAKLDYAALDEASQTCRIRLNSTAVDVRNARDRKHVDVTYIRNGKPESARARHVVLACYNEMIPHICPEVSPAQKKAIEHAEKVPLVYISVAVRNWKAWHALGTHSIYAPQSTYMHSFGLDFPVSIGDYRFTDDPSTPAVIHGTYAPTKPDMGLTDKQQSVAGRGRLLTMSFDDHERLILGQLNGALKDGGFDAERDIAGITVNRWPHGYAYEYNDLYEPAEYNPSNGPHIAGRARMGRISIANSDSSAYAYVDGAIDAADRAVSEQLALA